MGCWAECVCLRSKQVQPAKTAVIISSSEVAVEKPECDRSVGGRFSKETLRRPTHYFTSWYNIASQFSQCSVCPTFIKINISAARKTVCGSCFNFVTNNIEEQLNHLRNLLQSHLCLPLGDFIKCLYALKLIK